MRIFYAEDEGLVVSLASDEPKSIVRVVEALIKAFEPDSDVSFLQCVLITAKAESEHTLQ